MTGAIIITAAVAYMFGAGVTYEIAHARFKARGHVFAGDRATAVAFVWPLVGSVLLLWSPVVAGVRVARHLTTSKRPELPEAKVVRHD